MKNEIEVLELATKLRAMAMLAFKERWQLPRINDSKGFYYSLVENGFIEAEDADNLVEALQEVKIKNSVFSLLNPLKVFKDLTLCCTLLAVYMHNKEEYVDEINTKLSLYRDQQELADYLEGAKFTDYDIARIRHWRYIK